MTIADVKNRLGRIFNFSRMSAAYQQCFYSAAGANYVLPDLAEYTRAAEPAPIEADLFAQGRAAGRRDVWLHIQQYLNLTDQELFALYAGHPIQTKGTRL